MTKRTFTVGFDETGQALILNLDESPCISGDIEFILNVVDSYREQRFPAEGEKPKNGYVYLMAGNGYWVVVFTVVIS